MKSRTLALVAAMLAGCGKPAEEVKMVPTPPPPASAGAPAPAPPPPHPPAPPPVAVELRDGPVFRYAVPAGWRVQEDGQFAVVLIAPDNGAVTVMVGNSGLPVHYPPARFLHEKLLQLRITDLRYGPAMMARPMAGCSTAWEFEVAYTANGEPCRGLAKCSAAYAYDVCTMVVTFAASKESQWAGYASWLPAVADHVAALNGAAFGARGIMAQNLRNSIDLGEQARQNREWSARTWADVSRGRAESQDRSNAQFRENLGAVQSYTNPYDANKVVELPTTFSHYWVDRQGRVVGTNDPREDPNAGSTGQWSRMAPLRR